MIVPEQYTQAGGVVCKCLAHLANKKREEKAEDYELDYEMQGKGERRNCYTQHAFVVI